MAPKKVRYALALRTDSWTFNEEIYRQHYYWEVVQEDGVQSVDNLVVLGVGLKVGYKYGRDPLFRWTNK